MTREKREQLKTLLKKLQALMLIYIEYCYTLSDI